MQNRLNVSRIPTLFLLCLVLPLALALPNLAFARIQEDEQASNSDGKKVLTVDDYGRWNRIDSAAISPDGKWMTYAYSPAEGDKTFFIRSLESDAKPTEVPYGSSPAFSDDSQWLTYVVGVSEAESKKLRKSKKPVVSTRVLLNLTSNKKTSFKGAANAVFAKGSKYAAVAMNKPNGNSGSDLLVVNLTDNTVRNIGNVASFSLNKSGEQLAYAVDAAKNLGNGIYVLNMETNTLRHLDSSDSDYSQLTWNKSGDRLAALRGKEAKGFVRKTNDIIVVANVGSPSEKKSVYSPGDHKSFPEDMVISEFARLSFSEDGAMVFTGLKKQQAKPEKSDGERPNVDVWHWQDARIQSVQQRRAARDRRATHAAVFHIDQNKLVRLADDDMSRVTTIGKGRWGIGVDNTKYAADVAWGGSKADYYRVDLATGEKKIITSALGRPMGYSPNGKWFVFLKGGFLWAHDLDNGKTVNLSKKAPSVNFVNEDDDHPYEKPAYGIAGWSSDQNSVIVNHKFDLWQLPLDDTAGKNLTGGVGEADQIRFRLVQLDSELETIDLSKPLLLSAYGEWTKKSGYYSMTPGEKPTALIFEDKSIGRPTKAKNSDRVMLTMQTFEDFPNYWTTNTQFENPQQVTDANPQQSEYHWGRRILVDYKNGDGTKLQATLALPANYEEGKKYPMLVYFYEKMSQRHHQYSVPRFDDRPHMSTYASDGYLVLMPDVVYKIGRPGSSALDCVTSAVQATIDAGFADEKRIVLQGHSWGGYQSSFILTQTDMFAAVVTGAPVTNLVSFHGELYKSSGTSQQGITEKGQVRMGTSPWDNMELYHSQSPVHNVRNITTPFIILHGTDDGAVDWHQGLEYYNAARRNGKQAILLSYPNEGHHLANKANQIDFQIRMKQFFDHYAKGTEAPSWMTSGVPFLEKDTSSPRPKKSPSSKEKQAPPKDDSRG